MGHFGASGSQPLSHCPPEGNTHHKALYFYLYLALINISHLLESIYYNISVEQHVHVIDKYSDYTVLDALLKLYSGTSHQKGQRTTPDLELNLRTKWMTNLTHPEVLCFYEGKT